MLFSQQTEADLLSLQSDTLLSTIVWITEQSDYSQKMASDQHLLDTLNCYRQTLPAPVSGYCPPEPFLQNRRIQPFLLYCQVWELILRWEAWMSPNSSWLAVKSMLCSKAKEGQFLCIHLVRISCFDCFWTQAYCSSEKAVNPSSVTVWTTVYSLEGLHHEERNLIYVILPLCHWASSLMDKEPFSSLLPWIPTSDPQTDSVTLWR